MLTSEDSCSEYHLFMYGNSMETGSDDETAPGSTTDNMTITTDISPAASATQEMPFPAPATPLPALPSTPISKRFRDFGSLSSHKKGKGRTPVDTPTRVQALKGMKGMKSLFDTPTKKGGAITKDTIVTPTNVEGTDTPTKKEGAITKDNILVTPTNVEGTDSPTKDFHVDFDAKIPNSARKLMQDSRVFCNLLTTANDIFARSRIIKGHEKVINTPAAQDIINRHINRLELLDRTQRDLDAFDQEIDTLPEDKARTIQQLRDRIYVLYPELDPFVVINGHVIRPRPAEEPSSGYEFSAF